MGLVRWLKLCDLMVRVELALTMVPLVVVVVCGVTAELTTDMKMVEVDLEELLVV